MRNVLVTGTDGGAAQSIMKCLRMAGSYRIVATGIDPQCIGVYRGDVSYVVSKDWSVFKGQLCDVCAKEAVDIVVPGSDCELDHFVENREWYKKNFPPIIIDWKNVALARDKYLLQKFLEKEGLPHIGTWTMKEVGYAIHDRKSDDLLVKPRNGLGSRFTFKNVPDGLLPFLLDYIKNSGWEPIMQEQVEGEEYSCMTLRAKDGELLCFTVAWSEKKFGMSYKTVVRRTGDEPEIEELISSVTEKLGSVGPLSIQFIKDKRTGELKIFELNARFSGAQIVRAFAGVNMPDLAIRNWLDGVKEYPKVKKALVAYWYHDFAYSDLETFQEAKRTKIIDRRKLECPKYL